MQYFVNMSMVPMRNFSVNYFYVLHLMLSFLNVIEYIHVLYHIMPNCINFSTRSRRFYRHKIQSRHGTKTGTTSTKLNLNVPNYPLLLVVQNKGPLTFIFAEMSLIIVLEWSP